MWAERFKSFSDSLKMSPWSENQNVLEKFSNQYRELSNSVAEFSDNYEVINSLGILTMFLTASFNGYFLLILPKLQDLYDAYIVIFSIFSLVVNLLMLGVFFASVHHLNKEVRRNNFIVISYNLSVETIYATDLFTIIGKLYRYLYTFNTWYVHHRL